MGQLVNRQGQQQERDPGGGREEARFLDDEGVEQLNDNKDN